MQTDAYDEYVQKLPQEIPCADAAKLLSMSPFTFAKWRHDAGVKGLRATIFRDSWSITREDFAIILRLKKYPLHKLP